ncbi:Lipopolysaccharide kinase (Kdo/WaaP) family [Flavobacterium saliperosum S13]|uniref:Lipopolysaccharide kinase (Kdo/WaaP) family protein n=2 Tax=Flavobacterium saliperosum TaxID=329186 RepID=A0A1G4VS77_9FLAO|nr:lipopolysaccharide kinase InaA family protein [Flavobacterium saliperosum]ESU24027.1 Lipopolysaccharide kinase (Kdo/WaaP) family [Flavobacterium saliperosum S13]SCX11159.1 Lipopolysaccharide kinase (Kdo/WaaP) family protein [Flavobacterium saliperosum]
MRIIIHPKYAAQEKAILQLVTTFFDAGNLIVKGSRNTIKSNALGDEKVNIKYFKKPGAFKSIIYSFFRSTKAKRSYDYANYLLQHNIPTPFPIAYIEERNQFGLLGDSYYVSEQIDYDFTIRELIHNPLFPERNRILEQFTEFTFKMHEANVNFLDHSPGNTLIIKKGTGDYEFYLIDLNRMQFGNLSIEARMDNFKKMWLSKTMVKVIAKKYAELSGQSEEKLHAILLEKTRDFKRKITKKKWLKRKLKRY